MRYHVYTEARHPTGAVASGHSLTVYDDAAGTVTSSIYAAASGGSPLANPYVVPATGIVDFWAEVPEPYTVAQGDDTPRPLQPPAPGSVKTKSAQAADTELRLLEVQAAGTGKAPWALSVRNLTFNGIPDPSMYIGYNQVANGTLIQAGENALSWGFEADYLDTTYHRMEAYLQYVSANGLVAKRPIMAQLDRTSNRIIMMNLMGQRMSFFLDASDAMMGIEKVHIDSTGMHLDAVAGADSTLTMHAAAGRGSSLNLGYGAVENVVSLVTAGASLGGLMVRGNYVLWAFSDKTASFGAMVNTAALTVANTVRADIKGLVAKGIAGQSVSLFEVQNSDSAVLSTFSKNGYFTTRKVAAPADAELIAGEMAFWFDATDGAGKLMVKAKTANGTVATASVALA